MSQVSSRATFVPAYQIGIALTSFVLIVLQHHLVKEGGYYTAFKDRFETLRPHFLTFNSNASLQKTLS